MLDNGFYGWLNLFEAKEKSKEARTLLQTFESRSEEISKNIKDFAKSLIEKNKELGGHFLSPNQLQACDEIVSQGINHPEIIKPVLYEKFRPDSLMVDQAYQTCWGGTGGDENVGLRPRKDIGDSPQIRGKRNELGTHTGTIKAENGRLEFNYEKDRAFAVSTEVTNYGPGNIFVIINRKFEGQIEVFPNTTQQIQDGSDDIKIITINTDTVAKYRVISNMVSQSRYKIIKPFPSFATKFIFRLLVELLGWVSKQNIENVENFRFEDFYELVIRLGGKGLRKNASKGDFHDLLSNKKSRSEEIKASLEDKDELFGDIDNDFEPYEELGDEVKLENTYVNQKLIYVFENALIKAIYENQESDPVDDDHLKKQLLDLASTNKPVPDLSSPLGKALIRFTNPYYKRYDREFAKNIESINPNFIIIARKKGQAQRLNAALSNLNSYSGKSNLIFSMMNFFTGCFTSTLINISKSAMLAAASKGKEDKGEGGLKGGKGALKAGRFAVSAKQRSADPRIAQRQEQEKEELDRLKAADEAQKQARETGIAATLMGAEDTDDKDFSADVKKEISEVAEEHFVPELYRCLKQTQEQARSLLSTTGMTEHAKRLTLKLIDVLSAEIIEEIDNDLKAFVDKASYAITSGWFVAKRRQWPYWLTAELYANKLTEEKYPELIKIFQDYCGKEACKMGVNYGLAIRDTLNTNATLKENIYYNLAIPFVKAFEIYEIASSGKEVEKYKLTHKSDCGQIYTKTAFAGDKKWKKLSPDEFPYSKEIHHASKLKDMPAAAPKKPEKQELYSAEDKADLEKFAQDKFTKGLSAALASGKINKDWLESKKQEIISRIRKFILEDDELASRFQYDEKIPSYVYDIILNQLGIEAKPELDVSKPIEQEKPKPVVATIVKPITPPLPIQKPEEPKVAAKPFVEPSVDVPPVSLPKIPLPKIISAAAPMPEPEKVEKAPEPVVQEPKAQQPSNLQKFLDILNKAKQGKTT